MPLYDEEKAERAITELPKDVRLHLAHVYRNGLQTIVCCLETDRIHEAKKQIGRLSAALKELGL